MARALESSADAERAILLVSTGATRADETLADALERELVSRGIAVARAAEAPPARPYVRVALREREGEDPALIAEVMSALGERVDIVAVTLPRAVVETLAADEPAETVDGFFVRRSLGRTTFAAVDILLLANPTRTVLARCDSIAVAPAGAVRAPVWGRSIVRTLPPTRDPAALLFREDADDDGIEEIVWIGSACSTAIVIEERAGRFTSGAHAGFSHGGLRAALRPVAGRGYFTASPADTEGAALPLEIYDLTRGDFDADGVLETAVTRVGEQAWVVSERFPYGAGVDRCGGALAAADLDADGRDELIVTAAVAPGEHDYLTAYRWDGIEFREIGRTEPREGSIIALDARDLDGDGRDEIAALERRVGEKGVSIHLYRLPERRP